MLAVARAEVDGICADYATVKATQSDWINQRKIVVLAQFGLTPLAGLDHVPMGIERVRTRSIARRSGCSCRNRSLAGRTSCRPGCRKIGWPRYVRDLKKR